MPEPFANLEDERPRQEAASWFLRLREPDCSDEERAEFRRWQAESAENAREYAAMEDIWAIADRIPTRVTPPRSLPPPPGGHSPAGAPVPVRRPPPPAERRVRGGRPRDWRRMAMAAGVGALAVGSGWAGGWSVGLLPGRIDYYSQSDAARTVVLPDGTEVAVNLRTTLLYAEFRDRRSVRLSEGEAYFDVAHDRRHPFSVHTANGTVTVTGTRFNLWSDPQELVVTLLAGEVSVSGSDGGSVILAPGQQARLRPGEPEPAVAPVDAVAATAWRNGKFVLKDMTLDRALPMINRYLDRPLRIGDPRVAAMRLGGIYDIAELAQLPAALGKVLPLRAVSTDQETILYSR